MKFTEILVAVDESLLHDIQEAYPDVPVRITIPILARMGLTTHKILERRKVKA